MSYELDVCNLTAGELDSETNMLTIRATVDITGIEGDDEHFGDLAVFGQLGVTALPAAREGASRAEGVVIRGIAGSDGAIIGARDTRSASVYAGLKAGDTVLHATDAAAAAQFQAKANRQAIAATKDSSGNTMMVNLDGKNDVVQITAFGALFEINQKEDRVFITNPSGKASIIMAGGVISLVGTIVLGGTVPFAPIHSGPAPTTSSPTPGVFAGA